MYNKRVPKTHSRIEACGAVDELNAALGYARAVSTEMFIKENLLRAQKDLVPLMGELATLPDDMARYRRDGFEAITAASLEKLDRWVAELEAQKISFKGWATPGGTVPAAALDLARVACRRSERRVCAVVDEGELRNPEILKFLNRLSDVLWLLARWTETKAGVV
jgi:cob(I)alamin adenosyltransferase